ncbi:alcohol dehydrogenase [Pseudooceanicola sediminis]|uniref:alcohol dehydrogenase n=1 Tax=Pseudooceanicola sediminis TaxID=2211117 RepID=A0A399J0Y4_9RHOB|nr:alcohol dehydrogenase [Pseudooceanicola sediminis]KAA2315105.1 alcohol dehydrogenase catalytic domain-containing protein [Puniceibacterium sp. HSS470]RII38920.1 alcohol dehydrogenase [Pseudooceanicola sediminis]|tara:strand:+ start:54775 stop:55842 length:1068 start_codon:yes stop_codon:yes gene_type:complete
MQCQCIQHFGQPLIQDERPDMTPTGTEVILEVTAAGVCHTDLHMREGGVDLGRGERLNYADRGIKLPLTVGHETVGRVIAAGPDAGEIDMTRNYVVFPWCGCGACDVCRQGDENLCATPRYLGIHVDGGYATQLRIAHPRYLFDIGDLDPARAAPLACSGLTTFSALKKLGDSYFDQPPLLIGAGGLGLMCIRLLAALGAKAPVVADIDPAKRAAALEAGAAAVIDPASPDVLSEIASACGGTPPRAILDFVGAEATAKLAFNALARNGKLVTVGLFGGAAPWSLPMITLKSVHIMGSYVGSLTEFAELIEIARSGAIDAIPSTVFPLDKAEETLNLLEEGKIVGRAVLSPATQV